MEPSLIITYDNSIGEYLPQNKRNILIYPKYSLESFLLTHINPSYFIPPKVKYLSHNLLNKYQRNGRHCLKSHQSYK